MLRQRGLVDLRIRAAVVASQDCHPYLRLAVHLATSLRSRILEHGLMTRANSMPPSTHVNAWPSLPISPASASSSPRFRRMPE